MSEPTKVIIEVSGGVVCNVYGPNVEYVVVDWDDIRRGGAKPNKNQFWPARPHVDLDKGMLRRLLDWGK